MELRNGERVTLSAGDILVLPRGAGHVLRSSAQGGPRHVPQLSNLGSLPLRRAGDGSSGLDMLCGSFHHASGAMLFDALPHSMLVAGHAHGASTQLSALVALLRGEADSPRVGARSIIDALSSALFALVIRAWLEQAGPGGAESGVLALAADTRLGPVWQAILAAPERSWTIEQLAELAAMSRATFMRAFVRVAGCSPWELLIRTRMELARTLLARSNHTLTDIAQQVGYQSQASFSKKFKALYGVPPGAMRRQSGPGKA